MDRAATIPAHDAITAEDGTTTIHLTGGGTLNLIEFPDGTWRLMVERRDMTWGLEVTAADVWNLRMATGHAVMGAGRC